jgi:hypothetical protein
MQATLILAGPTFDPDAKLTNPNLIDMTPTLLHLLGQPVARDMKGRVLFEAWKEPTKVEMVPSYGARPEVTLPKGPKMLDIDDSKELNRLRTLGYVE